MQLNPKPSALSDQQKSVCGIRSRARSLALFDRRALLHVAMLLRDSDVARAVRRHLLDAEHALRELEQTALARRAAGEPLTRTWAEACAIIRQRYGTDYGERTLTRLLRQAGLLRQTGAPKARYKELFWSTGTSWEIHAHAVPELLRRATQVERELRAFAGIQTRLEVEYAAALER
ncbi:hypothetical protein [Streptomyces sp. CC210A]|uniref:hypothetical protein n=1 Tax=Streptomyces sp. CC210A TaxID=2898184 RepID=UPI001F264127|nr:hypothetical protein [Streptomyces sp. CC210A]